MSFVYVYFVVWLLILVFMVLLVLKYFKDDIIIILESPQSNYKDKLISHKQQFYFFSEGFKSGEFGVMVAI